MTIITEQQQQLNSSNQSDQSSTLSVITRKLGHDLDEIRVRSLDHLESKLDNNLISEDDLVVSRDLFVKLLEILPSPAASRQTARVLLKLMRWSSTAKTLLLLNGLDLIDKVKLETSDVSAKQDLETIVQQLTEKLNQWTTNNSGSYSPPPPSQTSTATTSNNNNATTPLDLFDQMVRFQLQTRLVTLAGYNTSNTNSNTTTMNSSENNTILAASQSSSQHLGYSDNSTREKFLDLTNSLDSASKVNMYNNNKASEQHHFEASHKSLTDTVCSNNTSKSNPSQQSIIASSIFQKSLSVNNSNMNNNMNNSNRAKVANANNSSLGKANISKGTNNENRHQTVYYWLPLTREDKKFLETTENTLRSEDMEKIKSYCTFLQTNVFNDFPAEVFLQRSTILKILTDLTIKSYNSWQQNLANQKTTTNNQSDYLCEETSLLKCLITCFHYYCSKLRKRIDYIKDPSTFCCKDFYSSSGFDFMSRSTQLSTSRSMAGAAASTQNQTSISSILKHGGGHHRELNTSSNSIDSQNSALLSSIKSTVSTATMASTLPNRATMKHSTNNKKVVQTKSGFTSTQKQQQQQQQQQQKGKKSANLQIIIGNNNDRRMMVGNNVASSDESESASVVSSSDLVRVDETLISDLQASIDSLINVTNIENYETDLHDKVLIQKNQEWPIHSFCFKLMETLIENLSLVLIKNNNFANAISISTSLVPIICETINLIVEILTETKLEWSCLNLNDVLMNLFQKFKRNLKFLYWRLNGSDEIGVNRNLNILNRTVYTYLVVTFFKIVDLLQSLDETNILMPNDLAESVFLILNDVCLVESFKPIEASMASLLATLDNGLYDIYSLSNEICESMRCACEFLMKYNNQNNATQVELLDIAKKSLNYMDYHICTELTTKLIEFSSKFCINMDNDKFKTDIEYLVTSCMMSKNDEIRLEAYSKIYKLVNESLNVQVATEVNSKRYKGINFLLLNKIFYQFITFGLFDKSSKVRKVCENILQHLLLSELLIPDCFRQKLTQLITIYMPFIQCFANLTDRLGQCILKMSDDMMIPPLCTAVSSLNVSSKLVDDGSKLFLSPAIERLRCSLRYLFFKEKNMRKKGYQQSLGFLTKYHKNLALNSTSETTTTATPTGDDSSTTTAFFDDDFSISSSSLTTTKSSNFNLNDFFTKYSVEKYCDLVTRLKRTTRTFVQTNFTLSDGGNQHQSVPIFQTENLLKIYNIFTSDSVDIDLKKNASEQLMIMIATGDERLHRAFINLDGVNYFLRYLKNSIVVKNAGQRGARQQHLFLCDIESLINKIIKKEKFDRIQANCISLLCHIFYWNHDVRQLYLFDIEIYRLIMKCLIICLRHELIYQDQQQQQQQSKSHQLSPMDANLYSNCQEDLACLLFTLLFHQVSSLDYYHHHLDDNTKINKFDLSTNLKSYIHVPFSMNNELIDSSQQQQQQQQQFELKNLREQQLRAYELNYRLELLLRERIESVKTNHEIILSDSEQNPNKQRFIETRLRDILDNKFRLYWNFKWHGGTMLKLCNDLIYNEVFVQNPDNSLYVCIQCHLLDL